MRLGGISIFVFLKTDFFFFFVSKNILSVMEHIRSIQKNPMDLTANSTSHEMILF